VLQAGPGRLVRRRLLTGEHEVILLRSQILLGGHVGPVRVPQHRHDPAAVLGGTETPQRLRPQHDRDPGCRDSRAVRQGDQGLRRHCGRIGERLRRHRIAFGPEHHQEAILHRSRHLGERQARLVGEQRRIAQRGWLLCGFSRRHGLLEGRVLVGGHGLLGGRVVVGGRGFPGGRGLVGGRGFLKRRGRAGCQNLVGRRGRAEYRDLVRDEVGKLGGFRLPLPKAGGRHGALPRRKRLRLLTTGEIEEVVQHRSTIDGR
jgi:hypothetical protein